MPIGSLKPYGKNPRLGDVDAIRESLEHHGQFRPLVVRKKTGEILGGNHTWKAAQDLGWEEIDVVKLDVTPDQAKRIVLVDNRTSDLGGYDDQALADLLRSVEQGGLLGTGYATDDLDKLLADVEGPAGLGDPDPVPELPVERITQDGDLWALGDHRLLCGDSTSPAALQALMDGAEAAMMWTDPPYGVDYVGKTKDALTIANDGAEGIDALLRDAFEAVDEVLRPGAAIYIAHPAGVLSLSFGAAVVNQGWRFHLGLVWVKDAIVLGHSDYHYRHEPLILAYKAGGGRRGRGGRGNGQLLNGLELRRRALPELLGIGVVACPHPASSTICSNRLGDTTIRWYGDNSQDTIFEVARPKASPDHPTSKPVDLIADHLRNSCPKSGVVLDPFGGSGSTLIAAEQCGRASRLMELDPRYCDVIVKRWEAFTGGKAERCGSALQAH